MYPSVTSDEFSPSNTTDERSPSYVVELESPHVVHNRNSSDENYDYYFDHYTRKIGDSFDDSVAESGYSSGTYSSVEGPLREDRRAFLENDGFGWRESDVLVGGELEVVLEEYEDEDDYEDEDEDDYEDVVMVMDRDFRFQVFFVVSALTFAFFVLACFVAWAVENRYVPNVVVQDFQVQDMYSGTGVDHTGVFTRTLTTYCNLNITVYNPAPNFGFHVSSDNIRLVFLQVPIAEGELKIYQPKKSHRTSTVNLRGNKIPLYGAGLKFDNMGNRARIPLSLKFTVTSKAYILGKLIQTTHHKHISCNMIAHFGNNDPITMSPDVCSYS